MKFSIKYKLYDEHIFEKIDSEEKAYWLGFLMADTTIISSNNKYSVEFCLSEKDKYMVEKFSLFLNSTPLHPLKKRIINDHPQWKVCCNNKTLVKDLICWGCTERKSLTKKFPVRLDVEFYRHFIRGYFDGNSSVSINKEKTKICFSFVSSKSMCESIEKILKENNIIQKYSKLGRDGLAYNIKHSKKDSVKKFFKYLYDDSTIYLKRKYEKFIAVLG